MLRRLSQGNQYVPSDAATLDYRTRVQAAGGTLSTRTQKALDRLVKEYKSTGVWDRKVEIGLFVGSNLAAALVKLKYPATGTLTNVNFVEADYSERRGLIGNGTDKSLASDFNPTLHLVTPLDSHISVYGNNVGSMNGAATVDVLVGATVANVRFFMRFNEGATRFEFQTGLAGESNCIGANNLFQGQYLGTNRAANDGSLYYNGVQVGTDTVFTSAAFPNTTVQIFAHNEDAVVVQQSPWISYGYSIGLGMTAIQALADYRSMLAFNQSVRV